MQKFLFQATRTSQDCGIRLVFLNRSYSKIDDSAIDSVSFAKKFELRLAGATGARSGPLINDPDFCCPLISVFDICPDLSDLVLSADFGDHLA